MQRTGLVVALVLLLASGAAAVIWWTGVLGGQVSEAPVIIPAANLSSTTREAELVTEMSSSAANGGYAANFSEQDVGKWQIADGQKIERFSAGASSGTFARFTSPGSLDETSVLWPQLGLTTVLPLEFSVKSNGKKVQIGVIARSASSNGANEMSVVYATQQAGNSGWQKIKLKGDFALYTFEFDVPLVEAGYANPPVVAVHSDASGGGKSVELLGIFVKLAQ